MNYSETFRLLDTRFNQTDPEIRIKEAGLVIRNFSFHSKADDIKGLSTSGNVKISDPLFPVSDAQIDVNNDFRYSVFLKDSSNKKHERVILMFHGLNERRWSKYLPWAASLVKKTGIPVVLFPISFHMNRSPSEWSDPRVLMPLVQENAERGRWDETTTVINFTLSKRLKEAPERFFLSGYQSIKDVVDLINGWKNNENPYFGGETKFDFFSYSIGAFLTEVLMIANPNRLLDDSRFFFFCGGSLFSGMNPASRFILNKSSFERIKNFYTHEFETEAVQQGPYREILNYSSFGKAFRAMLVPDRFQNERNKAFSFFGDHIRAVGLKEDTVVPPQSISEALGDIKDASFEEMDFPFPYSHENPFNARLTKFNHLIEEGFERVMNKAGDFLAVH